MYRKKFAALAAALFIGVPVHAQFSGVEFSAETLQRDPQGNTTSGKMYVGNNRIRTEGVQDGKRLVQIIDNVNQVQYMLLPEEKRYMERRGSGGPGAGLGQATSDNPCAAMPGTTCRELGVEKVAGRAAKKWEISMTQQGQTMSAYQWVDQQHGFPIRSEFPNGQSMELRFLGQDKLGGRPVEKWQMIARKGDEKPSTSLQWYDPRIKLTVKQEYPGGYVSEMTNIREGKQPDSLFQVPAGFQRITQPAQGGRPGYTR